MCGPLQLPADKLIADHLSPGDMPNLRADDANDLLKHGELFQTLAVIPRSMSYLDALTELQPSKVCVRRQTLNPSLTEKAILSGGFGVDLENLAYILGGSYGLSPLAT